MLLREVKVTKNLSLDDVYRRMARGSDRTPSASPARALEALLHKEISSTAAAANDDDGDGDSASLDLFALMSRYFDEISFEAYFSHLQGNDASLPGDSQSLLQKCHESHDALSAREIRRRAGVLDLLDPPPSDAPLRAAVSAAMGLIAAHRNTGGDRACGVLNDSHFLLGLNEISSGHSEQIKKSDPSSADLCVKYLRMFLSNSDAMAAVVVWFLWDISNRQDIYASLQRNVDSFLASGEAVRGSSLFHRDVHDPLMLFRCCFLESLRMHPPCADGVFITTTEHVPAGEHSIHKNSVVNFPYYSLLRPLWMEDPNEYLPRRWTDVHHQYDTLLHVFALIFEEDEAKHPAQFAAIYNIIDVVLHIIHTYDFRFESITPSSLHVLKPTKAFVKLNRRVRATSS
jgi:cytochrome P450